MAITVKVTGETYRVYPTGTKTINSALDANRKYVSAHPAEHIDYPEMMEAVKHAFRIAGEIGCDVMVDRVTHHEAPTDADAPDDIFGEIIGRTETITAELHIPMPHFTHPPLSRYNPVNGWAVPETITLRTHNHEEKRNENI